MGFGTKFIAAAPSSGAPAYSCPPAYSQNVIFAHSRTPANSQHFRSLAYSQHDIFAYSPNIICLFAENLNHKRIAEGLHEESLFGHCTKSPLTLHNMGYNLTSIAVLQITNNLLLTMFTDSLLNINELPVRAIWQCTHLRANEHAAMT